MTTEQIIQRLLDRKHITVAEAFQMLKDLVRNEYVTPKKFPSKYVDRPQTVMYGVVSTTDNSPFVWRDSTATCLEPFNNEILEDPEDHAAEEE